MTILKRPIIKPLLAVIVTAMALALDSKPMQASGECFSTCLWGCPTDKHFYCRVSGGSQCGFSAYCSQGDTCGALQTELHCTGFAE